MSHNMLPLLAANDLADMRLIDSVMVTQCCLGYATRCVASTDFSNIILCQLRQGMHNAASVSVSARFGLISHVVELGSFINMRGITARRIVALMKAEWFRQPSMYQSKCNAVSAEVMSLDAHFAVSPGRSAQLPRPAGIRATAAINVRPKPFNLFWGKIRVHFADLHTGLVGCRARSVDALPGLLLPQFYHEVLKALTAAGQFADVTFDGTAWRLTGNGSL